MTQRLLNLALRLLVKREVFIILNIVTLLFSIYAIKDLFAGIMNHNTMNSEELDGLNDSLDGLAGIMVAIGVFMEERETIQKIAGSTFHETDPKLNEIAHHNGLGLLLIGLFMEIFTLLIESPRSLINVKGLESFFYCVEVFLIVCAIFICLDFILDYIKSYKRFSKTNITDTKS